MNQHPPRNWTIAERVKWLMNHDITTIQDAESFKSRWGEYPLSVRRKKAKKSEPK